MKSPSQIFTYFANTHHLSLKDFSEVRARVRKGQTLTKLLKPHGLTHAEIFSAAKASKRVFDVRKIRSGRWYSIIRERGNRQAVRYFIYEKDSENYVIFDFSDSVRVQAGHKTIELRTRTAKGTIETTLGDLFSRFDIPSSVLKELKSMFNNRVDIGTLQKGDKVQVAVEEKYALNKQVGFGHLTAAVITTRTDCSHAYRFVNNGKIGYYDEKGNSLEKSFLKAPLNYRKITSPFTMRRLHPVLKRYRSHPGIDFAAPRGTPVKSVADGRVIFRGYCRSAGNYMKIEHPGVGVSEYLHFSKFHPSIKKGKLVSKGDVIGYVGTTGYATGPHLDLRFMIDGKYVDYTKLKLPDGSPIPHSIKPAFEKYVALCEKQWGDDSSTVITMNVESGDSYDPMQGILNFPDFPFQKSDKHLLTPFSSRTFGPIPTNYFLTDGIR